MYIVKLGNLYVFVFYFCLSIGLCSHVLYGFVSELSPCTYISWRI